MLKTKGDINKKYQSYDDMFTDVINQCIQTKGTVFVNYTSDNKPKKKCWQFWKKIKEEGVFLC